MRDLPDNEIQLKEYLNSLYRLAYAYVGNKPDAEDVVQEVFLRRSKRGGVFKDAEHEKAWLIRVTINTAKSLLASSWKRRAVLSDDLAPFGEYESGESEVLAAVMKLNAKQRSVIHLYYYEDYPVEKIAGLTGMNASTVKSHLKRAREAEDASRRRAI